MSEDERQAVRQAALEEAAKLVEFSDLYWHLKPADPRVRISAAIRALADKPAAPSIVDQRDEIDRLRAMKAELVAVLDALTKAWESETYEAARALLAIARPDGGGR